MSQGRDLIDRLTDELGISIGMAARGIAANRFQAQFDQGFEIGNFATLALLRNANPSETAGLSPSNINTIRDLYPDLFSPSVTTVEIDTGGLDSPVSFDAGGGAFKFIDDASVGGNVQINNFSSDDVISFINAAVSNYSFANEGEDVTISYNYLDEGTMNVIKLTGVVSSDDLVYDLASFTDALGFDAFG